MELETHGERIKKVLEEHTSYVELSNRVTDRAIRTFGFGIFHPESFQSMGAGIKLIGRMAYELAILAPHTRELYQMRKELKVNTRDGR